MSASSRSPVRVEHFSDLLCVWAYVAQARVNELRKDFGDSVDLTYHLCPVFADTHTKIVEGWKDRGGTEGYARHVRHTLSEFDHVGVHEKTWSEVCPPSSLAAHLYLHGLKLATKDRDDADQIFERALWRFRTAFFQEARDIATRQVHQELAAELELPHDQIMHHLADGTAHASMYRDHKRGEEAKVDVSPTLVFNEERQRLAGNVGYRIIEANVRELVEGHVGGRSWC